MDVFSKSKRSSVMSKIRSRDTKPERVFRQCLHRRGFRFRLGSNLPGKPDIVLPKYKTVVQVHGCFWHQHSCLDGRIPKSRLSYWGPKLHANKKRDKRNSRKLRSLGFSIFIVWECQIFKHLDREIARFQRHITKRLLAVNR
jgi:DNA mismatch endonuclease, patch repair protein